MNIPEPNLVEHHQQEILLGTVVPHQLMNNLFSSEAARPYGARNQCSIRKIQACMFLFEQNLSPALAVGYSFKRIGLFS